MQFDVEGVSSGGSILIGTIAAGESKSGTANLRPDSGILGEVSGALTISYEDDYGEKYSESVEVSSTVTEKAVAASTDETKENRNPPLVALPAARADSRRRSGRRHTACDNKQKAQT